MRILNVILFIFFFLLPTIVYSIESEICQRSGKIGKHKDTGGLVDLTIHDRLEIAQLEIINLQKLYNKIPRVKPETYKWIEEELESDDLLREFNLMKYDEYYQYKSFHHLTEMIGLLMFIENLTKEIIKINSNAYPKLHFTNWIYYISLINDYDTINSLAELYKRKIMSPPQDWQQTLDFATCMNKAKEMTWQLLGQFAEDNNL